MSCATLRGVPEFNDILQHSHAMMQEHDNSIYMNRSL